MNRSFPRTFVGLSLAGLCGVLFVPPAAFAAGSSAGAGKAFNPDVSANFLGLYVQDSQGLNDRTSVHHSGFSLQEAELQLFADVDPYLRANVLLSIAQAGGSTDFGIDPEEVFVETINLPVITLRGGKFKAALGKHNQLHTHAFPFIDQPLINTQLLGDEGLNEAGLSASALIPTPWFSELTVQGMGSNNATLFNSPRSRDVVPVVNYRNLWDLSEELTAELALYGTRGNNSFGLKSQVFGGDLILKWRPSEGGKYHALIWASQYLDGLTEGNPAGERLGGLASWLQYQFAERWWVQGRGEVSGVPTSAFAFQGPPLRKRVSALVGFFPSEFSGFRLQYDRATADDGSPTDHRVAFQYNITIGAHPAHSY